MSTQLMFVLLTLIGGIVIVVTAYLRGKFEKKEVADANTLCYTADQIKDILLSISKEQMGTGGVLLQISDRTRLTEKHLSEMLDILKNIKDNLQWRKEPIGAMKAQIELARDDIEALVKEIMQHYKLSNDLQEIEISILHSIYAEGMSNSDSHLKVIKNYLDSIEKSADLMRGDTSEIKDSTRNIYQDTSMINGRLYEHFDKEEEQ